MDQCQGKTKAGNRCKRSASAGSPYCSTHAGQARGSKPGTETPEPDAPEIRRGTPTERDPVETLVVAAVLGVAIIVVMKIGRLFRL